MKVENIHSRVFPVPAARLGKLLDTLAGETDMLWPRGRWPAMRLDRPLQVGATGGHGPIRYAVEAYASSRSVVFRFTHPKGFLGTHAFAVDEAEGGSRVTHTLAMRTSGLATLAWLLAIGSLHDALLEDLLDHAARQVGAPSVAPPWPLQVRFLRKVLSKLGRRRA